MRLSKSDEKRFWSKVDIRGESECWEWQAATHNGYGRFGLNGINEIAHRVAWVSTHKRNPKKGYDIAHTPIVCHNRRCCNPKHLSEKTRKENTQDRITDGTQYRGGSVSKKLVYEDLQKICDLRGKMKQKEIGKMFGITFSYVSLIQLKKGWKIQIEESNKDE